MVFDGKQSIGMRPPENVPFTLTFDQSPSKPDRFVVRMY